MCAKANTLPIDSKEFRQMGIDWIALMKSYPSQNTIHNLQEITMENACLKSSLKEFPISKQAKIHMR